MKFKFLEHRADTKFQAYGKNLEEAFANAALALSALIVKKADEEEEKKITVGADDLKELLYVFLEELLFLVDTQDFFLNSVENLTIKKGKGYTLHAVIGGSTKKEKYEFLHHVKAITYSEMEIQEEKGKAMVQVVVET